MKLIVFSDTHGIQYGMKEVMRLHQTADCFLHLGDGAPEFAQLCRSQGLVYAAVRGNCDFGSDLPLETVLNFEGFTFYLTHGHTCQVKFSTTTLRYRGEETGADVILFGHTHRPLLEYHSDGERPYYLLNPGSLGRSYGQTPTYAIIEIKNGNLLLSHGSI